MNKKFRFLFFLIPFILCSCTGTSNIKKYTKTNNNLDKVGFIENFFLDDINCNFNFKGIDINYKGLNGSVNMFNIYALTKEREVEFKYKSSVEKGNVKVIILMPGDKVVNMFEGKKRKGV